MMSFRVEVVNSLQGFIGGGGNKGYYWRTRATEVFDDAGSGRRTSGVCAL